MEFPRRCMLGLCIVLAVTLAVVASDLECCEKQERLENVVNGLARQVMLQQLMVEEKVRSDGCSGLKQIRLRRRGSKSYYATTFTGSSMSAAHDHANNERIVGMGELNAVLNGVEFRTRHNDYELVMNARAPPNGSIEYHKVEDIPFPEVPPSVTGSIEEQITEMRKYFEAWAKQDSSIRDYKNYFKPVLCYLEGTWTSSDQNSLDESFDSDRHHLDAKSWLDLQDKIRFTAYTGRKNSEENYAYLPTTIVDIIDGVPVLAQWNYRILCHPLSRDVPLNRLAPVDTLHARASRRQTLSEHLNSRAARHKVAPTDNDNWRDRAIDYSLLDSLMKEIPGKNGYDSFLVDEGLDKKIARDFKTGETLNAAYYHRSYIGSKGAMGRQKHQMAFSDETLYRAKTTQAKVAAFEAENCRRRRDQEVCETIQQKWTYAIPMEIIYLTPLQKWNPYGIEYREGAKPSDLINAAAGIDGETRETPLEAIGRRLYYQTPAEFFGGAESETDPADTSGGGYWVKDKFDIAREVVASGQRILMPELPNLGHLRMRFVIAPVHAEGSAVWKELDALKELVLNPKKFGFMFHDNDDNSSDEPEEFDMTLRPSLSSNVARHTHQFTLTRDDILWLWQKRQTGELLQVSTDEVEGHSHTLYVRYANGKLQYRQCDDTSRAWTKCWDEHPRMMNFPESVQDYFQNLTG